jgi:mannan endo-1,4-beta-mannosidase
MAREIGIALAIALMTMGCAAEYDVDLVDDNATTETKALYKNLKSISTDHVMFGHQDDLAYGVHWKREPGRSDVKDVAGSYPAVFGWELGDLEHGAELSLDAVNFEEMKGWIRDGFEMGGLITIAWHMDNPVSGGDSWDPTPAVHTIIPGGQNHELYKQWLDRFAEFASDLEVGWLSSVGLGTKVPIVFRPFHEHTGSWFWWGGRNVTAEDYVALWRFTVEYLRDEKGLDHLLYAYSPDKFMSVQEYLEYYPGDEYVDVLGVDDYSVGGIDSTSIAENITRWRLATVSRLAAEKGKVWALTETGSESIPDPNWWTQRLLPVLDTDSTKGLAWVLVWRNHREEHHYAPYDGHPSADDFVKFREHPMTLFLDDLPGLYK